MALMNPPTDVPAQAETTLYEDVAQRVAALIDGGTYRPGDRLPSVRGLHAQLGVSVTTVLEAYRLLEDRGVIRARPQSGYYVRQPSVRAGRLGRCKADECEGPPVALPEPGMSTPAPVARPVRMADMVTRLAHRRSQDDGLVDLSVALPAPELVPAAKLNRLMGQMGRRNLLRSVMYDTPPGCEPLRVQLARRALAAGCTLTPDQIVTTNGAQEAIILSLRAVCQAGDTVAVESPMYFGVWQALDLLGLRAVEVPTCPRQGICLDSLGDALDRHPVKAVVAIPTFGNPLGGLMPEATKRRLVRMLAEREVPLVEDDIYGDLAFPQEPGNNGDGPGAGRGDGGPNGQEPSTRPKAAKAFDEQGLVLLCSSFTKTLAPGYRVGWVAAGWFQERVEHLKFASSIATAVPPQLAVAEFLNSGGYDRFLRRIRRAYAHSVSAMRACVCASFPEGTRVTRPAGGFVLWAEMPQAVDAMRLADLAFHSGVAVAPGPMFTAQDRYRNCIRLTASRWDGKVEAAVRMVGRLAGSSAAARPQRCEPARFSGVGTDASFG
jgi:DNA-binding transcriptional MocR family regulator